MGPEGLLDGKIALVTGGARGIGEAIVRTFADQGASVVFVDKNRALGYALEEELNDEGFPVLFSFGDLTKPNTSRSAVDLAVSSYGGIDILVNNAGVNDFVGLEDDPRKFLQSLKKNLLHYFYTAHFAREHLISSRGTIINISSKVALMGEGHTSGYAAAKGGILGLTKEWALDLAQHGIRVNAIVPAQVWTPLAQEYLAKNPKGQLLKERLERSIPLERRFTSTQEVANTALFLASDLSTHITGSEIYPNGGYFLDNRFLEKGFK